MKKVKLGDKGFGLVVYDDYELPQGLKRGERFVLSENVEFYKRSFPKGTPVTFVAYIVKDGLLVDGGLLRFAVFRIGGKYNGILSSTDIEKKH